MSAIIVYFSQTGNTEYVAHKISEATGLRSVLINVTKPYPTTYENMERRVRYEIDNDIIPKIDSSSIDLDNYGHIFLGSPLWYGRIALPTNQFVRECDFKGRTVYPFITYGGIHQHYLYYLKSDIEKDSGRLGSVLQMKWGKDSPIDPMDKIYSWLDYCYKTYHIR